MHPELHSTLQRVQLCMLQKLDELFQEHDIQYWICGGTLLGAIRHGGFVPHDDDVDLECFEKDLERLAQIPLDPPLYTGFVGTSAGKTWEGHPVAKLEFLEGLLEVDVFPRPNDLPEGEKHFPSRAEVFPLTRYRFHNIEVWGPNRSECGSYLDRCYGKDWKETVCVYNHDYNWWHGAGFDARKEVLALEDYNDIVRGAGVPSPTALGATAKETFAQLFPRAQDLAGFVERYESYRFQRTLRRNRAAAEHRERLKDEEEQEEEEEER